MILALKPVSKTGFLGLDSGGICQCANKLPTDAHYDYVFESECSIPCPGDKRFNCGAGWRQAYYAMPQSSPAYIGMSFMLKKISTVDLLVLTQNNITYKIFTLTGKCDGGNFELSFDQ